MRLAALALALLCASALSACKKHSSRYSRPGDDPHDTDSLYVLYRRILMDSDPKSTGQQIFCAYARLADKLGDRVAGRRLRAMRDTVYAGFDERRWRAADRKLVNHAYELSDSACGPGFEFHYIPDTTAPGYHPLPPPKR